MESFQKRKPTMHPEVEAENWTPSSYELASSIWVELSGTAVPANKLEPAGVTLMVIPDDVASELTLSSVARETILCVPGEAFHV